MKHVFICYSQYDLDFVNALTTHIEQSTQLVTWVDRKKLRAGDDWRLEIDQAIRDSLSLIVVMTPDAKASEYVTYEWALALGVGIRVIPLLLKPTDLHPRLDSLHYLDFTNANRPWNELIQVLQEVKNESLSIAHKSQPDLQAYPPDVQYLLDSLSSVDPIQRSNAIEDLSQADHSLASPVWVKALDHPSRDVRAKATEKLSIFGVVAVTNLINSLRDPAIEVREAAAKTLGSIGYTEPGLLGLLDALHDDTSVCQAATGSLAKMGKVTIPGLINVINGDNSQAQKAAFYRLSQAQKAAFDTLSQIGVDSVDSLIELSRDSDEPKVRITAIEVLGEIAGSTIVPDLVIALGDQDSSVRRSASKVLGKVGNAEIVPVLLNALNDQVPSVRGEAARALGQIGDITTIPHIIALLGEDVSVGYYTLGQDASRALIKFGSTAIPFLIDALEDSNIEARYNIANLMGDIGEISAIPSLLNLLSDEGEKRLVYSGGFVYVSAAAKKALESIGTPEALAAVEQHDHIQSKHEES